MVDPPRETFWSLDTLTSVIRGEMPTEAENSIWLWGHCWYLGRKQLSGSGTMAVVALQRGRKFVGCDLNRLKNRNEAAISQSCKRGRILVEDAEAANYRIRALNNSGLIAMTNAIIGPTSRIAISSINEGLTAMTNAIISPTANPTIVPAATPRQSIFCSLVVISTSQSHGKS
jgi:hypothetical protein